MTTGNGSFDAESFYDEGMAEAKESGFDPELDASDTKTQEDSALMSQVSDDKGEQKPSPEQAEQKTETSRRNKATDSSAEDVKAALESTEEQEPESTISKLLPKTEDVEAAADKTDRSGKYVPVEDHIKLRQRAQQAEAERDELKKARLEADTQTGGEKPGTEAEKSPLEKFVEENPDEDFVPAAIQLEERKWQDAMRRKEQQARESAEKAERDRQAEKQRQLQTLKAISDKAVKAEAEFRKATPDYEAVTNAVINANLLTNAEKLEFLQAENPAKRFYEICKAKVDALRGAFGLPDAKTTPAPKPAKQAPSNQQADEDAPMTDDEIFDELKGMFKPDREPEF